MSKVWSDEDAAAALNSAVEADAADEPNEQAPVTPEPDSPEGESEGHQVQPDAEPEAQAADAPAGEDTFDGGRFNPDELPEELKPAWRQLQGAFTQKTQALAEQQRQFEALGDPKSLQAATELYQRIADPQSWSQLYTELTQAMQQHGIDFEPVANKDDGPQPAEPDMSELDGIDDPDVAPLAKALKDMRTEVATLRAEREQERRTSEAERQHQALMGEHQRMLNAIAQSNPHYEEDDLRAVQELGSFYGGNLIEAQQRLENYAVGRIEKYLAAKSAAAAAKSIQPGPKGAGTSSSQTKQPETLRDAEEEAVEFFRAAMAQDS